MFNIYFFKEFYIIEIVNENGDYDEICCVLKDEGKEEKSERNYCLNWS